MNIIFLISSYGEIPLMIDALSRAYRSGGKIKIIIFDNQDLKLFFELLKEKRYPKILEIDFVPRFQRTKYLKNYLLEKKYYYNKVKSFSNIKNIDLCYCFTIYQNGFCFQFIKYFINNINSVYLYEPVLFSINVSFHQKISNIFRRIINWYIYEGSVSSRALGHKNIDIIGNKIKTHPKVKYCKAEESLKIKKSIVLSDYYYYGNEYKVIFFEQPLVNYGRVSKSSYETFISNLKIIFKKQINEKSFAVKLHPGNHTDVNIFDGLKIIDGFIPSQCLGTNSLIWLSVSSQSISHTTTNKIKKVSLINLIEFRDAKVKRVIKNNFKKNIFGKIYLPESFEQLLKIKRTILSK
jgi:hypothetical protein